MHERRLSTLSVFQKNQSAGIAFSIMALVALSPYEFTSGYLPALLLSVVLSLAALFLLASRIFTPSHFNLKAGVESAAVGGFAAGFLCARSDYLVCVRGFTFFN